MSMYATSLRRGSAAAAVLTSALTFSGTAIPASADDSPSAIVEAPPINPVYGDNCQYKVSNIRWNRSTNILQADIAVDNKWAFVGCRAEVVFTFTLNDKEEGEKYTRGLTVPIETACGTWDPTCHSHVDQAVNKYVDDIKTRHERRIVESLAASIQDRAR
jgi:hypothetical protein